jgi:tRNA uridine 5-carboxymethylaminomethyl modification enzyme
VSVGAVGAERQQTFAAREALKAGLQSILDRQITADTLIRQGFPVKRDSGRMSLLHWLRFPEVKLEALLSVSRETGFVGEADIAAMPWPADVVSELEQDGRYAPYLERQEAELRDLAANEQILLPPDFDYRAIAGLSNEMAERLEMARPESLAAAGRVRGITPAALATILVHAKRAMQKAVA